MTQSNVIKIGRRVYEEIRRTDDYIAFLSAGREARLYLNKGSIVLRDKNTGKFRNITIH